MSEAHYDDESYCTEMLKNGKRCTKWKRHGEQYNGKCGTHWKKYPLVFQEIFTGKTKS